jgi:hypothetical protein
MSRRLLILAAICFVTASALGAGTNAEIPYKTIDEICDGVSGIDQTKLAVTVQIGSTNKNVRPSDIVLKIQSASGVIPVEVSTNGQIVNFPHRKDLLRENPPVISNQPKGSLSLFVLLQFMVTNAQSFRYSRLADGVAEANKAIKTKAGMLSFLAPKAEGVIFFFSKTNAGKAKVEIESASGRREHIADKDGKIKLKLEKSLLSENPEVKISESLLGIMPDIE